MEALHDQVSMDIQAAEVLREALAPRAVKWFLGEEGADDSDDDEYFEGETTRRRGKARPGSGGRAADDAPTPRPRESTALAPHPIPSPLAQKRRAMPP